MQPLSYLDFDLSIRRENSHYVARVLHSPAGEASCIFKVPFSEEKLENLILIMSHIGRGTRSIVSPEMNAAREFGGRLFDAIFPRELIGCLRSSLDEADRHEATGLRFKLRLQDAPELAKLPWEFLFDRELARFFAQSDYTPIVRYLEMPERITPLAIDLPLRILVMISSPEDPKYPPLNLEREKAKLEKSLGQLTSQGKVKVDWLEEATLTALQRRLRTDMKYHVFHFMGHGGFDEKAGEGLLLLEDELRRGWPAEASRIATILHDHKSLRLAVLNSCEGARTSSIDPFAGSAATLIRQGIPAVVAMQFEITDNAAITFSAEFYDALADGLPVDAAVSEARKAIFSMPNDLEWGTPVLHMRSPDGILFNIEKKPIEQKPVEQIVDESGQVSAQAPNDEIWPGDVEAFGDPWPIPSSLRRWDLPKGTKMLAGPNAMGKLFLRFEVPDKRWQYRKRQGWYKGMRPVSKEYMIKYYPHAYRVAAQELNYPKSLPFAKIGEQPPDQVADDRSGNMGPQQVETTLTRLKDRVKGPITEEPPTTLRRLRHLVKNLEEIFDDIPDTGQADHDYPYSGVHYSGERNPYLMMRRELEALIQSEDFKTLPDKCHSIISALDDMKGSATAGEFRQKFAEIKAAIDQSL